MIGAMPAVAVRHERRKQEKRGKRPSQLHLGGLGNQGLMKQPSPPSRGSSPAPSPLASPPSCDQEPQPAHHRFLREEFYVCGKVSVLHLVVVSLLLGAILLIVGLVQLKPGADASDHRYYLMATGTLLMVVGLGLTALRCWALPRLRRRRRDAAHAAAASAAATPASAAPASRIPSLQRLRKGDSEGTALDSVLVSEAADGSVVSSVPHTTTADSLNAASDAALLSPTDRDGPAHAAVPPPAASDT